MDTPVNLLVDFSIIALILIGVRQFRSPRGALRGNWIAAVALGLAVLTVAVRHDLVSPRLVIGMLLVGAVLGWLLAVRVSMIQTPAMVALQHGAGGVAAFLVCFIELVRDSGAQGAVQELSGVTGLVLGAATFSGSLVAGGKLANLIRQPPQVLRGHGWWVAGTAAAALLLSGLAGWSSGSTLVLLLALLILVSAILGTLFSVRIGGADMPVLISFLNATAGLAAAFAGVVIGNRLLVAAGATVAASGSVLTIAMCRAMNRGLFAVFRGFQTPEAPDAPIGPGDIIPELDGGASEKGTETLDPMEAAAEACRNARSVIFVPGYGMAMAQAQFEVVELARTLESQGKSVRFAIHPVAGRMPGHMHVLLSEAEAPYDKLCELHSINSEFGETDLAIVVGASDVVNPAAGTLKGTPISGMPILKAHEACRILVVNLDDKPGYSGVRNLLYDRPNAILVWGDAKRSLRLIIDSLEPRPEPV
jgi:H+-translocating NAD(P) transhydrogenase subunit beta